MPFMRWDKISKHLSLFKPSERRYLEIGVRAGRVGKRINANIKIGVDPTPMETAEQHYTDLYRSTSDDFFNVLHATPAMSDFHVIFIDGLHHYDQVMRDIENSLRHLDPNGMIIVHDCNPPDEASQIVPRMQVHWNGDVWKAIVRLRATRSDLHVYTIDADEGLGIIQFQQSELIEKPSQLTWEGLIKNREEWLGLVSVDWKSDALKKRDGSEG